MKKILLLACLIVGVSVFYLNLTSAQTSNSDNIQPQIVKNILVATVNIYDAANTQTRENAYQISFRLKNRIGIQGDIRYGIELVRKADKKVVDMQLENQALTLGAGESKNITLTYALPSYLPNDTYQILIIAQNAEGITLGVSPIGFPEEFITISNNTSGVSLNNCYLTVTNDASTTAKYRLDQGVDIKAAEELKATCSLLNYGSFSENNLKLQLITHQRTQFGDILSNHILENNFSLKAKQSQNLTFTIPTEKVPQAYDVEAFLINAQGEKVSISTYLHYVIVGASATLQNVTLDKISYQKGDTALVSVFWTPGADTFPRSRLGGTKNSYTLKVTLTSQKNTLCGEITKKLTPAYDLSSNEIKVPMEIDCAQAIAKIQILDEKGNILSTKNINLNNPSQEIHINEHIPKADFANSNKINKFYIVLFIAILALIGYGILVFRNKAGSVTNK